MHYGFDETVALSFCTESIFPNKKEHKKLKE